MPRKGGPKILTGARSQENYPDRDVSGPMSAPEPEFRMPDRIPTAEEIAAVHAEDERRAAKGTPTEGKRIYQSKYSGHRLQYKTARDIYIDGRLQKGDNVAIQFKDGVYSSSDPGIIAFLDSHTQFGIEFWDLEALKTEAAVKRYEDFIGGIRENPELLDRLRQDLSKEDFDLVSAIADSKKPLASPAN